MRTTFRILEAPLSSKHGPPTYVHVHMAVIERRVIQHLTDPGWMDCPLCKQSATARYSEHNHACNRCGWVQNVASPQPLLRSA